MRLYRFALSAILALNVVAAAQTQNSPSSRLVIDGVDGATPLVARPDVGESLTIDVHGQVGRPFVLAIGADVQNGLQFIGPGLSIDIGPLPSIAILMSGLDSPAVNPFNLFANTGAAGLAAFSLPISPSAPVGLVGGLQAFVVDFTAPFPVIPSAATRLYIGDGTPDVLAAVQMSSTSLHDVTAYRSPSDIEPLPGLGGFEFLDVGLQRYGHLSANEEVSLSNDPNLQNSPGAIDRNVAPTPSEPRWFGNAETFPFVRTVHGDIYIVRDAVAQTSGFLCVRGTAASRISSSFVPSPAAAARPWHRLLNFDDGTLSAVERSSSGVPIKVKLFKIDGSAFASTGTTSVDITPVSDDTPAQVFPESVTICGGSIWFVAATASSPGALFRAPLDGSSPGQMVSFPAFSITPLNLINRAFPEIFLDGPRQRLWVKVSNPTSTTFGIVRIDNISPTGETVTLEPATVLSQAILDFGRAANGLSGRFAVSPSGNRFAWCGNNQPDLFMASLGDATPLLVTSGARFANPLIVINDLHLWAETRLLFWLGANGFSQDLYDFDIVSGTVTNVTLTNGQSGATLPITATPASRLDASGQFRIGDKLVFYAAGLLPSGPFAGSFGIDIAGVVLPSLLTYNITGDRLPGASSANVQVLRETSGITFGATGSSAWFVADDQLFDSSASANLYSFDANTTGPAISHLTNPSPSGLTTNVHSLRISSNGHNCFAVQSGVNINLGDRVVEAFTSGGFQVVVPDFSSRRIFSLTRIAPDTTDEALVFLRVDGPTLAAPRHLVRFDLFGAVTTILQSLTGDGRTFVLGVDTP